MLGVDTHPEFDGDGYPAGRSDRGVTIDSKDCSRTARGSG
jgi:hypothetical protein